MQKDINSKAILNNGVEIPYLGLGVFKAGKGKEGRQAILDAIEAGYRHIDTASIYGNEEEVGFAVKNCGLPREEIFVTTKVWNTDQGYDQTKRAFEDSLSLLGLDYIDLYLIHWPVEGQRLATWKALVKLYREGKCRAIGVSNYLQRHLLELFEQGTEVIPAINQIEFSPFLYQKKLHEFCHANNIQLQAYSPLTRTHKFDDPTIVSMASKYRKTPAQILIRWALEHDVVVIPKSSRKKRIIENANVFDFSLTADDMQRLDALNEDFRVTWDPTQVA